MDADSRRTAGAVAGALAAGAGLSLVMLAGERTGGEPSELIELERRAAARAGLEPPAADAPATLGEQLLTHGGHLALSAMAGLAYATVIDEDVDGPAAGAAFGAAFFLLAYGVVGPALGVTPPPWRERPLRAVQHPVVHTLFGVATAALARKAKRSPGPSR